jgi:hypothetical protein
VAARFRRLRGGGVSVSFPERESELLTAMLTDLDALLSSLDDGLDDGLDEGLNDGLDNDTASVESVAGAGPGPDPLAAMVGIGTATSTPRDPALARLFPDGYTDDDAASADFRRYTQVGLRDARRRRIATALATLEAGAHRRQVLDAEAAQAWLGVLNDLRLVLGERLQVTEDLEGMLAVLAPEDPRRAALGVYDWLGWVEETLVRALMRT